MAAFHGNHAKYLCLFACLLIVVLGIKPRALFMLGVAWSYTLSPKVL
jgi:hypothetical protein